MIKKILLCVSITLNVLFLLLVVTTLLQDSPIMLSAIDLDSGNQQYMTGAQIVSVPAASAQIIFGPVELILAPGDRAALQFSRVVNRRQANIALELVFDRSVITVTPSGYGVIIRAIAPGETVVQMFGVGGFQDVAIVYVEGSL